MLLGIPWLVVRATESTGAWRVIGVLAFGCGGLLMFATSTLYHAARRPTVKAVLRRLDHSAIYLLIAGTYTPFTLGVVRGPLGWFLFGIGLHTDIRFDWLDRVGGVQATLGQPDGNAVRVADCRRPVLHRGCALLLMEKPAVRARRLASFRVRWRCLSFRGHT
jgi:hypothetical protein